MTVKQVLASCFSTYTKFSETSVILTLDLQHQASEVLTKCFFYA